MAARAESDAVLNMPIPMTSPITIMVKSNSDNKGLEVDFILVGYREVRKYFAFSLSLRFMYFYFQFSIFHFRFFLSSSPLIRLTPGHWVSVIKREVRYYPGAIPVAVITNPRNAGNILVIFATVPQLRYGKAARMRLSQKTCRMNYFINELSGEKPEM